MELTTNNKNSIKINDDGDEDIKFNQIISNLKLLKGLEKNHYIRPSKIQLMVLKLKSEKKDLVIQAKAGLGKTLAFGLTLFETLNFDSGLKALIVAPTREIAYQITKVLRSVSDCLEPKVSIQTFIGGLDLKNDLKNIQDCEVAVGTPGRLNQLIQERPELFKSVQLLVLDEADKLAEPNFFKQIKSIAFGLPSTRRNIVASATFDDVLLQKIEKEIIRDPIYLMADGQDINLKYITQYYYLIKTDDRSPYQAYLTYQEKLKNLFELLSKNKFYQAIIFLNNQDKCLSLVKKLEAMGWPSAYISGSLNQMERLRVMDKARNFDVRVLVSSDLISRGVDIDRVDLVINLDLPYNSETYLHRIGRTGRFGKKGKAISFVNPKNEMDTINILKNDLGLEIEEISSLEAIQLHSVRSLEHKDVLAFSKHQATRAQHKNQVVSLSDDEVEVDDSALNNINVPKNTKNSSKPRKDNLLETSSKRPKTNKKASVPEPVPAQASDPYQDYYNYYGASGNPFYNFWLSHFYYQR